MPRPKRTLPRRSWVYRGRRVLLLLSSRDDLEVPGPCCERFERYDMDREQTKVKEWGVRLCARHGRMAWTEVPTDTVGGRTGR